MAVREINFDGIVGPTIMQGWATATARPGMRVQSRTRAAALQGIAKMRANLPGALGLAQGITCCGASLAGGTEHRLCGGTCT